MEKFSRRILFFTDYCYTPYRKIEAASILCEKETIVAVGNSSAFDPQSAADIFDLRGTYAVPGFIDTHIHGAGGFDANEVDESGSDVGLMCKTLSSHGVTSFIPTISSASTEKLLSIISTFSRLIYKDHHGASIEGLRLEGPYINKAKKGSQSEDLIRPIDLGEMTEIIKSANGHLKIVTFAPELDNSIKLIELLLENNVIPSMGHTMANEEAVVKAIEAGATHCTHIYNGMPILHHRSVGIAGVALTDDRVTVEVILDGYHIHPRMIDIVCRVKAKDKIIGISDAVQAAGLIDGMYRLGDIPISVVDGKSLTHDGVIAGTTLTLERGWDHLVRYSHLNITDAAACLSINPARLLSLGNLGEIKPGKTANITFFSKETNKTVITVKKGKIVYIDASVIDLSKRLSVTKNSQIVPF